MKVTAKLNIFCLLFAILSTGIVLMYAQSYMMYDNNWFQYNQVQPSAESTDVASPLSNHVIMFILDGGRYEQLLDPTIAPNISNFAKEGTLMTNHHCILPSISLPNYAAIGTGAPPLLTEVVYNDPGKAEKSFPVESLFDVINQTNQAGYQINSTIIAFSWWHILYPNATQWIQEESSKQDNTTALGNALLNVITSHTLSNFTLIHFTAPDDNAHKYGGISSEYNNSVSEVDKQIGLAYQAIQDNGYTNYTIIITADHGHTIEGGHGGQNPDVLHIPLIYYGPNIKMGQKITALTSQLDNTPTISYILGIRVPRDARGNILYDIFANNSTISMQHREARYNLMMLNLSIQQLYASKSGLKWNDNDLDAYVSGDPSIIYSQFQAEFNNGTNSSLISSETQILRIKIDQFFADSETKMNLHQAMLQGVISGVILIGIFIGLFYFIKYIKRKMDEEQKPTKLIVSHWIVGAIVFFGILTIGYLVYSAFHVVSLGAFFNIIAYHTGAILSFWIILSIIEIFSVALTQRLLYNLDKRNISNPNKFDSIEKIAGSLLMIEFTIILVFVLLIDFTVPIYPKYTIVNSKVFLTLLFVIVPLILFNLSLIIWSLITKIMKATSKGSDRKDLAIEIK